MNIAFVCFTYKNDADLVYYMTQSVYRLQKFYKNHTITLTIADDKTNPQYSITHNDLYLQTEFNRNGNLNGNECIKGMLDVFKTVSDKFKADWIIKLDSDVMVNNIETILNKDPKKFSHIFTSAKDTFRTDGAMYAISPYYLDKAIEMIEIFNFNEQYPEDLAMFKLFASVGRFYCLTYSMDKLLFKYKNNLTQYYYNDKLVKFGAIAFKAQKKSQVVNYHIKNPNVNELAKQHMSNYLDYIQNRPIDYWCNMTSADYGYRRFSKYKIVLALRDLGLWKIIKKWLIENGLDDIYDSTNIFDENNTYFTYCKNQLLKKFHFNDEDVDNILRFAEILPICK